MLVNVTNKWLAYRGKPHRVDMLIVILRDVKGNSSPRWLTPVSLEVQALCAAGRFAEAETIAREQPDLLIRGVSAAKYLDTVRKRVSERQELCGPQLKSLWELIS
jgi:hypothetical protein